MQGVMLDAGQETVLWREMSHGPAFQGAQSGEEIECKIQMSVFYNWIWRYHGDEVAWGPWGLGRRTNNEHQVRYQRTSASDPDIPHLRAPPAGTALSILFGRTDCLKWKTPHSRDAFWVPPMSSVPIGAWHPTLRTSMVRRYTIHKSGGQRDLTFG